MFLSSTSYTVTFKYMFYSFLRVKKGDFLAMEKKAIRTRIKQLPLNNGGEKTYVMRVIGGLCADKPGGCSTCHGLNVPNCSKTNDRTQIVYQ